MLNDEFTRNKNMYNVELGYHIRYIVHTRIMYSYCTYCVSMKYCIVITNTTLTDDRQDVTR